MARRRTWLVLLGCLALALAAGAAGSTPVTVPSFAAKKTYRTVVGFPPVVADLNGDRAPDIVTLASVLLNKGDGTFQHRTDYPTGSAPDASAVGDLNGDGRLDLVTANEGAGGTVSVLLNHGDGTFEPHRDFATGGARQRPRALAITDLNGDGKLDVVDGHGNVVSVLVGNGDGTLRPKEDYGIRGFGVLSPTSIAVADVNGDGKPDVVTAALSVLLNNGDGTFQAEHDYGRGGTDVAIADLNGDGSPDLVTWYLGCCDLPIGVFLNRGDGTFSSAHSFVLTGGIVPASGGGLLSLALADLNGDARPDLVALDDNDGADAVGFSVLLNRGDGSFAHRSDYRAAQETCSGCGLQAIAVGDVNGDGRPDLAATHSSLGAVSLWLNAGHGRFQARRNYPADFLPRDVVLADLNGDDRPDLLTTGSHGVSVRVDRPGLCNVQEVNGLRTAVAKRQLARAHCRATVRRVFDPKRRWPKGGVVASSRPGYGAVLPAASAVRLTVRYGRRG